MTFAYETAKKLCLTLAILTVCNSEFFVSSSPLDRGEQVKLDHRNAIVSNGEECAAIGKYILKNHNGTAVDAMIAVLFCEGVTVSQSMGIGGGFLATIYNKESGKVETLISRERAPLASHERMFDNMTAVKGILAVAVPGELKGYWEMHKRYGFVPWKTLIQPTIDLCRSGHLVTKYLAKVLSTFATDIYKSESLSEIFVNPETKSVWVYGDRIKREKLAETLELIAEEGADTMYTRDGKLAKMLVDEIQSLGGIITIDDFVQYKTEWSEPISTKLRENRTMYSVQVPSSGIVLAFILNVMNDIEPEYSTEYFHQLIESFKFGYALRSSLGDIEINRTFFDELLSPEYAKGIRNKIFVNKTVNDPDYYGINFTMLEDHGTAHSVVLAANGDAVSVTSTVNNIFGSKIHLRTTGIILNDEMDDFSSPGKHNSYGLPPSPPNFIKPGKRPMSSMCPVIVLDENGDAILLTGSAGGSKIITSVAYMFVRHMWLNEPLKQAVHAKRIHHQLIPMGVFYEKGFDIEMLKELESFGHEVEENKSLIGFTSIATISRARGFIEAEYDSRRNGSVEIFE